MTIKRPTPDQLSSIATGFGMSMTGEDIAFFGDLIEPTIKGYDLLQQMTDELPIVKYPRTPGYQPMGDENIYNAWYIKSEIKGAAAGALSGKSVVIKDNVYVAGVPMMNGASTLEGYMPEIDATIVTRILDAGGTIVGKAACEFMCFSACSHTGSRGAIHNPHRMGFSAGGSSSGSAALVAAGEVEMAIGCDQAGSIRMPSAMCGIYGMKPTYGLVPYTGIGGIEPTIDHTGPMTATVADNALLLEVIAGADGFDSRQHSPVVGNYREALGLGVKGLRIGVVREGFGHANSEAAVDDAVYRAGALFAKLGAIVEDVSIPMHQLGPVIWLPIGLEGSVNHMMKGNGFGTGYSGVYLSSFSDAHAAWRDRADELPDNIKMVMLLGEYFQKHYRGRFYNKAQNLVRRLRAAYDTALQNYDILLMPTVPTLAPPLPGQDASRKLKAERALDVVANTAPFDITHHPSMSAPCGMHDGLPIGMMLTAKHFDETAIYRAAHAFEQAYDWKSL
ncbi:amidase [Acidisoma cellulosilytica]|uniref:Amidase n=1 Tax=Acidisoma cellulosilyticum TaxID=2802395 RepID=A0A963Z869_9PROT|nr:amidase [Acidisoma cellulosilyticum]MCB8883628.1 amidase [Acidisoma cellulosilyticum]